MKKSTEKPSGTGNLGADCEKNLNRNGFPIEFLGQTKSSKYDKED